LPIENKKTFQKIKKTLKTLFHKNNKKNVQNVFYIYGFPIHSSPAIGFHSCFFFTTDVRTCICTHSIDPSLADGVFPGLRLALVPDVVVPEAEHGKRMHERRLGAEFEEGKNFSDQIFE